MPILDALGLGDSGNILLAGLVLVAGNAKADAVLNDWLAAECVRDVVIVMKLADVKLCPAALTVRLALAVASSSLECGSLHLL
jgi:hypothetical protein